MNKVFIIAEAGVNHNGSIKTARLMIDAASSAGADAVKFQTFKAEKLMSRYCHRNKNAAKTELRFKMLKRFELDVDAHKELMSYCGKKDIKFLSSPFDLESIDLLHGLGIDIFKVPSGEITNLPYLRKLGALRKRVILSTGMATLNEVRDALNILRNAGTVKKNITVLHCNTAYPTPVKDVNLSAMLTIRDTFKVNIGYSDHTMGIEIPIAAAALGAKVVEKHFTLDKDMEGPDHRASLEPEELKIMIKAIRNIEKALGHGFKGISPSEYKNRSISRKCIVAARDIKKGDFFNEANLTVKRPAKGISPMDWDNVIGKSAKRNFKKDEIIKL